MYINSSFTTLNFIQVIFDKYIGTSASEINFIIFKTKFINHITTVLNIKTKNIYWTYSYLWKWEQQPECIFSDCPLTIQNIFCSVQTHFPCGNLQTVQDIFTMFNVHVLKITVFAIKNVIYTKRYKKFYSCTIYAQFIFVKYIY